MRRIALALGLAAFVAVLVVMGWRRGPGEETTTLAAPSTTASTTTTGAVTTAPSTTATLPRISLVAIPADDVLTSGIGSWFSPLMAVSAGEVWAVMSTAEDVACVVGHLENGAWAFWRLTADGAPFRDLAVSPDGSVWAAGDAGVFSFDGEAWTRRFDGPAGGVAVDENGTVWIGGSLEGDLPAPWLARWDGRRWERVDSSPEAPTVGFTPMAVQPGSAAWVTAYSGGNRGDLLRYEGATFEAVQIADFPDPADQEGAVGVFAVEAAPNGDLWVGGYLGADWDQAILALLNGEAWALFDLPFDHTAHPGFLFNLAVGPDGTLWVGSESGLASFDGTEWTLHIEGRWVQSLDVAPDGTLWYSDEQGVYTLGVP